MSDSKWLSQGEAIDRSGAPRKFIEALITGGLIEPIDDNGRRRFRVDQVETIRIVFSWQNPGEWN